MDIAGTQRAAFQITELIEHEQRVITGAGVMAVPHAILLLAMGWAPDYVEAMWRMLQRDQPDDFVVASGVAHSLEELVAMAFAEIGLNWRDHVDYDSSLVRSSDIMCSLGDR